LHRWRHILPLLRSKITLFIPDLPGYGFSSPPPASDKRTVGRILLSALQSLFGPTRPIIYLGHDRGARIGHRLLVDISNSPDPQSQNQNPLLSAILIDIVPTLQQWSSFSHPLASRAYFHWPFLALPHAAEMILSMPLTGPQSFTQVNIRKALGSHPEGITNFESHSAVEIYAHQFSNPECVRGACADYAAASEIDVEEQESDQKEGRKVGKPVCVVFSRGNLGRMHDVEGVWKEWISVGTKVRFEGVGEGYGHYLPEEAPELVGRVVGEWIDQTLKENAL
jgi:pimeloyl-ACP methyl ester carboxylesterase